MNTYEYLFNSTVQKLQDQKDKERLQTEAREQQEYAAIKLLQDHLLFLYEYGYYFELIDHGTNNRPYRYCLKIHSYENSGGYSSFCYSTQCGAYLNYDNLNEALYTIDDIVEKLARGYFKNKNKK